MIRAASIFALTVLAWASGPDLDNARKLYQLTEFERSNQSLRSIPEKDRDGAVWELMGKNYYGLADYKKATEVFEKALAIEPENSEFNL